MKPSIRVLFATLLISPWLVTHAFAQLGGGKGGPLQAGTPALGASPGPTTVACTVISVNTSAFSFDCQGAAKTWPCNVYSTTVFALGSAGTTFYDLKVGTKVNVAVHQVGDVFAADQVSLQM